MRVAPYRKETVERHIHMNKVGVSQADMYDAPERIAVHLIAAFQPRHVNPGRLAISAADSAGASKNDARDLVIDYSHADFDAHIEQRRVDDSQLASSWAPTSTGSPWNPGTRPAAVPPS